MSIMRLRAYFSPMPLKLRFLRTFKGIGEKYARNLRIVNVHHEVARVLLTDALERAQESQFRCNSVACAQPILDGLRPAVGNDPVEILNQPAGLNRGHPNLGTPQRRFDHVSA